MYVGTSGHSIGFNLNQIQNGRERAIAYRGRNFYDTEKKYSVTERGALPIIAEIKKCKPYLLGNHFTKWINQALKWLMCLRNPTGRLARWALILQGIVGTTLLPKTVQQKTMVMQTHCHSASVPFRNNLCFPKLQQMKCVMCRNSMTSFNPFQYLKDETSPKDAPTANKNQKQEGKYFLSESNISCMQTNTGKKTVIQLVVPKALQMELLQWCQDHFTSGHLGLNKACKKPEVNIFLEKNVC